MERLLSLYVGTFGEKPLEIQPIKGAGSNRKYYRLIDSGEISVIGAIGTSREENEAFIYLTEHFNKRQLPVPKILAVSEDNMCYLQSDLGENSLFDALSNGRNLGGEYTEKDKSLLIKTIKQLPNIQIRGARGIDWNKCYPQPKFDIDNVMFDLNYFKYCFLKATNVDFNEIKLEAVFRLMAKDLTSEEYDSFMYRDFQARNVILDKNEDPYFIDYQGGRKGPYYYDLASFLWQASALYPSYLRSELVRNYYDELKTYIEVPSLKQFKENLMLFVMFRLLQVLGAYGFRGYFERKQYFIDSINPALQSLYVILNDGNATLNYPYLKILIGNILKEKVDDENNIIPVLIKTDRKMKSTGLKVKVFSFSYKKGIPIDDSGNGGGYVFDCRAIHNPGRYDEYRTKTGLDEEVIRFLENDGEILTFLDEIYKLADMHVERYMERGFTSLMFSFGCTGGQHRSVYSAKHLADHIREKYCIEVYLFHRELNIEK